MYFLIIALSKYTFILTLKLIISRENVDLIDQKLSIFHMPCKQSLGSHQLSRLIFATKTQSWETCEIHAFF